MKIWYDAVCDKHKELVCVMVDGPIRSNFYLKDKNDEIYQWLQKHYGCELRMVWRDDQMDELWDNDYKRMIKLI